MMQNVTNTDFPEMPGMTEEEEKELEKERAEAAEKELAPYRKATEERKTTTEIVQEHDNMLADMLYEMTMNEMEV